jgi:hypothetical protein
MIDGTTAIARRAIMAFLVQVTSLEIDETIGSLLNHAVDAAQWRPDRARKPLGHWLH